MEDSAKCTFCNAPEKPIPTLVDLKKQPHKNVSLPISCKHVCNLSFFLAKKGGAITPRQRQRRRGEACGQKELEGEKVHGLLRCPMPS